MATRQRKEEGTEGTANAVEQYRDPFDGTLSWRSAFTGLDLDEVSFEQLEQALLDSGEGKLITELDDVQLVDKADLVGVPMILMTWTFSQSSYDGAQQYVVVRAVTKDRRKVVFVDGSTGIKEQLLQFDTEKPIIVPNGLKASNYTYTADNGASIPATTYYLDNVG